MSVAALAVEQSKVVEVGVISGEIERECVSGSELWVQRFRNGLRVTKWSDEVADEWWSVSFTVRVKIWGRLFVFRFYF